MDGLLLQETIPLQKCVWKCLSFSFGAVKTMTVGHNVTNVSIASKHILIRFLMIAQEAEVGTVFQRVTLQTKGLLL